MAADIAAILDALVKFVDFEDRSVIAVGAGGGQLAAWAANAREVLAVDCDAAALDGLRSRVTELGLADRFLYLAQDFLSVGTEADIVLFEVSLHEMPDPGAALAHAARLAAEVVVLDHAPGSAWTIYVDEVEKVAAAWRAIGAAGPLATAFHDFEQRFYSHAELHAKVASQGARAIAAAAGWIGRSDIVIPMRLGLARLAGARVATAAGGSLR